ncbi:zinc-ribbon domain-containing protein [Streptomyces sp. NPDC013978]|uniref:zinc-ribbon domain-containing protein n=1 Tax=Streptomyces sp. NPDC013978 TaxID=3364869 RepID=UPI00370222F7
MSDDGGSMTSYCPHCGTPGPDGARFCMTCGRERLPVPPTVPPGTPPAAPPGTPPTAPPVPATSAPLTPPPSAPPGAPPVGPPPPPPPYAPVPARPSPVGAFFGRALRGDWGGSAVAALWPVGLLLAAALALAIPSYGQGTADEDDFVGFGDRLGLALAGLLQGLGGGFTISESGGGDFSGDYRSAEAALTLTFVPLTVTVLFIGALFLAVRQLRTRLVTRAAYAGAGTPGAGYGGGRTAGLEAAVRVTLLVTAAVLLLGLFAQPEVARVEASTSPWRAALGALLLTAAVSVGVLQRDDLAAWLGVRPGPRTLFRATGTAVRAMAIVLALCSLVTFVVLAANDEWQADWEEDLNPLLPVLLVLPNLAVHLLGLSWGASVQGEAGRTRYGDGDDTSYDSSGDYGLVESAPYGDYERESFGLSELGDAVNSWAVVGALTLGVVCALVLGVLAARRSSGRGEQLLAAGVFFGLFLLLAGVSGFGMEASGSATAELSTEFAVAGQVDVGLDLAEALLFGLLWIFVAAFLAPYLVQMTGGRTAVIAPPVPAMPSSGPAAAHGVPGHPSAPAPAPYEPPLVELGHHHLPPAEPPKSRNSTLIWTLTIAAAFVIGGGGAAAIMLWQK